MKLKLMATVNFQRSEADNFQAVMKKHPHVELGPNDVVLMISMDRSQMVFMYRKQQMNVSDYGKRRGEADVYHSERLRLSRSTWDWKMLANYGDQVGIQIDGFRRFEEMFPKLRDEDNIINLNAKGMRKVKAPKAKIAKVLPIRKVA